MGREQPARQMQVEEPLIDTDALRDWGRLVPRAVGRRKWIAVTVFSITFAASLIAAWSMPKTYRSHVRILASPLEGAPGTVRPSGGAEKSELAEASVDVVRSQAVLRDLVHREGLVEKWERSRPRVFRWKDALQRKLAGHALSEAELEEAVAYSLEKRIEVSTADHVVDISVAWPDPESARIIVESLRRTFLDSRSKAELAALKEKAAALETQVAQTKKEADDTVTALGAAVQSKRKGAKSATVRGLQAEGRWRDLPDPALSALRTNILVARKAISEREDVQRKRVAELKAQYAEQQANLGPNHPALLETAEKLAAFSAGSPELDALKRDEQAMVADFVRQGGKDSDLVQDPVQSWPTELTSDDPQLAWLKTQLELQSSALSSTMRAAVDARVAVSAAEAQVPERYAVLQQALTPREPTSPSATKIIGGGLVAAFLLSLFAAVFWELRRGRIEEPWQVDRWLGVPTLAVVRESRK